MIRSARFQQVILGFSAALAMVLFVAIPFSTYAQAVPESWASQIQWRSIGPANMGGRITSIAVFENDPSIWYVASASGGLLKTVNNGVTFEHQFDSQPSVSIGDVQVSKTDPDLVWVGTGEANPRNSVSWGNGVYKSTDGGKTWKHMGLKHSFQIGRIAIHPENHDTVYVGALGRLWGPNEERGLFKTTDGGKSWEKVLYVDDQTGVVDVQMDPKNPDTLLVATYQRKRDGFDGNDPEVKYGPGAGIYKTTDGGKTFTKLTQGLPTVNMGRIGLQYFARNPKYVYAIIETEKIATRPENLGYLGVTTENLDVGVQVESVTEDSPAEKAGLQQGDIIVMIDGKLIHGTNQLQSQLRRKLAGETIKIVGSRDEEKIEFSAELGKVPDSGRQRRRRNEFTGTLGGQAKDLQGQQGRDKEYEYGGIYLSKDGGESWSRINTLNPRPMYYSQIRVDPSDRRYLYVLGTSLYRSNDFGETFSGDGGRGVHPDNHAMWINPNNGEHIILGNDGGLYVTHDRMDNWDHLNKFAIGQFYHVGVDHRDHFYNVYGGLQDNGSWGGPSRSRNGDILNTDWFRIGGGDGFICLVDPEDPNQLYAESQNGSMSRLNLKTGETGFVRPASQRGVRYRFNWKTPFILSPHNSRIHYSAGNYVFRSLYKGNDATPISPEITNTDRGAGSAISESPRQQGVIYVGTTDGAVWRTRDGGQEWAPLYLQRVAEDDDEAADEDQDSDDKSKSEEPGGEPSTEKPEETVKPEMGEDQPKTDEPETGQQKSDEPAAQDPVSGKWKLQLISDQIPRGGDNQLVLKLEDNGKVSGSYLSRRGEQEISEGSFDSDSGKLRLVIQSRRGKTVFEGKLEDGKIAGTINFAGRFTIDFEAVIDGVPVAVSWKLAAADRPQDQDDDHQDEAAEAADPLKNLSGHWTGELLADDIPDAMRTFQMELRFAADGSVAGRTVAAQGEAEIYEGQYNQEKNLLTGFLESDDFAANLTARVTGLSTIEGTIAIPDANMEINFSAKYDRPFETDEQESSEPAPTESSDKSDPQDPEPQADKSEPGDAPVTTQQEADSPIAGNWDALLDFGGREMELALTLKVDDAGKITGSMESDRINGDIVEGKFDSESGALQFLAATERSDIQFEATLENDKLEGTASIADRDFSFGFSATKSPTPSAQEAESAEDEAAADDEPLESISNLGELVPGPRWVSSLEASRFKAGRVYMTLDGHRSNDDKPYVFVSEDFGETWQSLHGNLPSSAGSTRVIREDVENEDLLYLGCEFSAWFSIDRGQNWTKFNQLPTVAVHEIAVHPTAGEIVAATHGRSLWVADVKALQNMKPDALKTDVVLYPPNTVIRSGRSQQRGAPGSNYFEGQNPSQNAAIYYSIAESADAARITISRINGEKFAEFSVSGESGLHRFDWNLRRAQLGEDNSNRRRGRRRFGGGQAGPGSWLVTLEVDGQSVNQVLEIIDDTGQPFNAVAEQQLEEEEFWRSVLGSDE